MQELAIKEKVELRIVTPILDTLNHSLMELFKKNLDEVVDETNRAIELGVKTDETAATAESAFQQVNTTVKLGNEIRLHYTRPIDAGKKRLMKEVEDLLSPAVEAKDIIDGMLIKRKERIDAEKARIFREAEETQRTADEAARKEQERRENISLGMGGTGEVAPVVAEKIEPPISLVGMRSTTRTRSIPDHEAIQKAVDEGVREIAGVRIFQVWQFDVEDSKQVPENYRRLVR